MKLSQNPEEAATQCALPDVDLNFVDYEVEVLDPKMSMFDKIAYAARTCYRSEAEATPETDKKLIAGCVKRGHTSVLEHGAISLYLDIRPSEESANMIKAIIGQKGRPVALRQIWDRMVTLSSQRYASSFNDPDMFSKHWDEITVDGRKLPKEADVALPVIVADVRAWREILRERIFIADQISGDPISWFVTALAVFRMYNLAPQMFDDIANMLINRVKAFKAKRAEASPERPGFSPVESLLFNRLTDEEIDNFCLCKFLEKFMGEDFKSVIAEEASPTMSVSIVLTTDRAVTHEHVRHRRDVGYSQESQRYVGYSNGKCDVLPLTVDPAKKPEGIEIDPHTGIVKQDEVACKIYEDAVQHCFAAYNKLRELGFPPESARKCLPNGTRTKIVVTWLLPLGFTNFMYWRTEAHAQYDIRRAADLILLKMIESKHPFLQLFDMRELQRSVSWMREQNMFNEETLGKIDQYLSDRKVAEEELMRQAEEERKIMEEQRRQEAQRLAQQGNIKVDDHVTKPVPSADKPPAVIKVDGNEQDAAPKEAVTERPATVQLEQTETPPPEACDGSPAEAEAPAQT